jgi:hypothetical protein
MSSGRWSVWLTMGLATCLACPMVVAATRHEGRLGKSRQTGCLVVQLRVLRRAGFEPGVTLRMPSVVMEDVLGTRDTAAVDSCGKAVFPRVQPGRVVVGLVAATFWDGLGPVRHIVGVGAGATARDTVTIACSIPRDALRDSVYDKAGIDSSSSLRKWW